MLDKLHGADLLGWHDVLGNPAGQNDNGSVIFRSDDFEALRAAAEAGCGVAFLPDWVAGQDVQTEKLIRLMPHAETWNSAPNGIYLLRALQKPSAKVRAFTDALKGLIGTPPIWHV